MRRRERPVDEGELFPVTRRYLAEAARLEAEVTRASDEVEVAFLRRRAAIMRRMAEVSGSPLARVRATLAAVARYEAGADSLLAGGDEEWRRVRAEQLRDEAARSMAQLVEDYGPRDWEAWCQQLEVTRGMPELRRLSVRRGCNHGK